MPSCCHPWSTLAAFRVLGSPRPRCPCWGQPLPTLLYTQCCSRQLLSCWSLQWYCLQAPGLSCSSCSVCVPSLCFWGCYWPFTSRLAGNTDSKDSTGLWGSGVKGQCVILGCCVPRQQHLTGSCCCVSQNPTVPDGPMMADHPAPVYAGQCRGTMACLP